MCYLRILTLAIFLLTIPLLARADILHLTNGVKVEGLVEKTATGYRLTTKGGVSIFPDREVRRWEKKLTPRQTYEKHAAALGTTDFSEHFALGKWAQRHGLSAEAKWQFMIAVAIKPNNKRARAKAGFLRRDGKWLTREERMARKGYVQYDGKWLPEAKATLQRITDDKQNAARTAYTETWTLLRRESLHSRRDRPYTETVDKLLALGPAAFPFLKLASGDLVRRIREVALATLGRMDDGKVVAILAARLQTERSRQVCRTVIVPALRARHERTRVLDALLGVTINAKKNRVRKRGRKALRALADKRVIATLIADVAQRVDPSKGSKQNPPLENDTATKKAREKQLAALRERFGENAATLKMSAKEKRRQQRLASSNDPAWRRPYYPAHDALRYLTGQNLPPEVAPWQEWWTSHEKDFSFDPTTWKKPPEAAARSAVKKNPRAEELRQENLRRKKEQAHKKRRKHHRGGFGRW